jgi:hypothetical protein
VGHQQSVDSEDGTSRIPRPRRSLRPKRDDDSYELPEGYVSRKRFTVVFGTATALFVVAGITFFGIGMVLGASLGPGLGGFVAQFENVSYTDGNAYIYPVLGAEAACDDAPQLEANLDGTTFLNGNITFYKDLPLPDDFSPNRMARISIVANSGTGPVTAENLNLRLTALSANRLNFSRTILREYGPNDYGTNPSDSLVPAQYTGELDPDAAPNQTVVPEYGIDADTFILPQGGTAAAHQVTIDSINLQNLDLYIAIDEKSDFSNPVERVVEPNNRTCASLADAR